MHDLTLIINNISVSILLINLIPVVLIYFLIPTTLFRRYQTLLIVYLSFASGGLMADVFLRLLPHLIRSPHNQIHIHSQSHDNHMGLVVLLGIFLSFFIEKFLRFSHGEFNIQELFQTNLHFHFSFKIIKKKMKQILHQYVYFYLRTFSTNIHLIAI